MASHAAFTDLSGGKDVSFGPERAPLRFFSVTHDILGDPFWAVYLVEHACHTARAAGFASTMLEAGVEVETIRIPGDDHEASVARLAAHLREHPDVGVVCSLGPPGCAAAIAALDREGRLDHTRHASFDLAPEQLAAVRAGRLSFTVDSQQYLQGYLGVTLLRLYAVHGFVPAGDVLTGPAIIGYAFMGQAHSLALRAVLAVAHPLPVIPELVSICGRDPATLERARARFGWAEAVTDWREQVADERVGLFVDAGPNAVHAEPVIAAARNGKHVFCEKPLGRNAAEAHRMWSAAHAAGVVHMTAFNYRFFPALRLARQMIAAGDLGTIHHFRSVFLDASAVDPDQRKTAWRFRADAAGSGALGDLGAHHIDVARYLVGEPRSVSATVRTFVGERSGSTVDVEFPPGHPLSWADSFTHEYAHLLGAIDGEHDVAPPGATFEDGYRCAEVCDAILDAARTGRRTAIVYRPVGAAP